MPKRYALFGALIPVAGLLFGFSTVRAGELGGQVIGANNGAAQVQQVPEVTMLSPYWHAKVQRWESLILQEAKRRGLDPDFLASLVWMESRGDPKAVGPVGAVGLMQVMPKEAGFTWRPARADLLEPSLNLFWGTRTLATVVRQGKGDIFNALAAYNGGWAQVMYRGPKMFAATILRDYARAVAARQGLDGTWSAFFAVQRSGIEGPIWVADSGSEEVYFYSNENWTPEGSPLIPEVVPTAVVADCLDDETGDLCTVGLWIFSSEQQQWLTAGAAPIAEAIIRSVLTSPSMMAGSARPGLLAAAATPAASPTVIPVPPTQPPVVDPAPPAEAATDEVLPTPTEVPAVPCSGGELALDAYPLERFNTPDGGWSARVYASGRGGDCSYTYSWNDESNVQGEAMSGPIVFEVHSSRRAVNIVGTAVMISGGEVRRVGLYIIPPGD